MITLEKSAASVSVPRSVQHEMDAGRKALPDEIASAALPWVDPATNVFFDFGSAELDERARATIRPIAGTLKADRIRSVILVGHTNDQNSTEYALALAALRITAVEQEMLRLGVARGQIHKRPVGRAKNVRGNCATESCLRTTRRVEILFTTGGDP